MKANNIRMRCLTKKNLLVVQGLVLILTAFNIDAQKINYSIAGGISHNSVFKTPMLVYDTIFSPINSYMKGEPTFGSFANVAVEMEIFNIDKLYLRSGILFMSTTDLLIGDSASSSYQKKYFIDPLISTKVKNYTFCFPLLVSYSVNNFKFRVGLTSTFLLKAIQTDYTLSGNRYIFKTNFIRQTYRPRLNFEVSYLFYKNFSFELGYLKKDFVIGKQFYAGLSCKLK